MKTAARIIATLSLLLTCFLGTAVAQNTNAPAPVRVSQHYHHKNGVGVTYHLTFAQSPESTQTEIFSEIDMKSWGRRMLDAIDKEFGDGITKYRVPNSPTLRERQIAEKEFLPRAVGSVDKWLKEEAMNGSIVVQSVFFEVDGAPTKSKGGKPSSTSGVTFSK